MNTTTTQATASTTDAGDCYAVRKVEELSTAMVAEFNLPDTQATLKDARDNYLAESIAINNAQSEKLAQKQQQTVAH